MSDSRPGMAPEARTAAGSIRGLAALPDDARLWIFGASRPLGEQDAALLISSTRRFLEEWAAHGRALAVAFEWLHNRFLLVAVDEDRAAASGCSTAVPSGSGPRRASSALGAASFGGWRSAERLTVTRSSST